MELLKNALSWPVVGAQILVAVVSIAIWRKYMCSISDIPGPFLASFTRLWHLFAIAAGDQNTRMIRLHDELGHFVRISHDEVSVSHPDAIKKLLLTPVPKGYWYEATTVPDYRFVAPFSLCNPKAKVELSKSLSPPYGQSNILKYEPAVTKTIGLLLGWMDQYAQRGEIIRLDRYFGYTALDVVGEVLFARPFGFLEKGYDIEGAIANTESLSSFVAYVGFYPFWRNLFLANPLMTWAQILPTGHIFNTTMTAIKEREKGLDGQTQFVLVDHWLRALKQNPGRLTLRNIYAQATVNVGAGSDTVNTALQSFFYHLLRHPTALAKAIREVDDAVADGFCTDHVVSFADAQRLPYLQAAIKEALRIFPPVSMGMPREVPAGGLSIGDRTFAKGTILSVSAWVVHYSREIWGPDAQEFVPERWLRDGAAEMERKYFITFGAGYNSCPGHHIAKMEVSKITATILRDYELRLAEPEKEWTWRANFSLSPHNWPVHIKKRPERV